jgi:Domain of unknown function (DUF4386)
MMEDRMGLEVENTERGNTQRTYARVAGFLFLAEIIMALGSGFILSRIAGTGTFAETAKRIAGSEHLYRAALSTVVIVSLSSAILAFTLYVTLKPVNSLLAQLAMIFSLGDSFLALVVRACGFVRLQFLISPQTVRAETVSAEAFSDLIRSLAGATENIGGISFGIGSLLSFYLFLKSRYLPRNLSALGLAASAIWTCLYFANFIFPEHHTVFQSICLPPMALADVITGLYLMLFAVNAEVRGKAPAAARDR